MRHNEIKTVAGLIKELSEYPPEMRVLVDGYESGYDDPDVSPEMVLLDEGGGSYNGDHEATFYKEGDPACPLRAVKCVVICR